MSSQPTVSDMYGPMLVGTFLSAILYGVVLVQSFIYSRTCRNDKWWLKALIAYIFLAETAATALQIEIMYEKLVARAGDPENTLTVPKLVYLEVPLIVMVSAPVQVFMAWRLKIIMGHRFIPALVVSLTLCAVGAAIMTGITVAPAVYYSDWQTLKIHIATCTHGVCSGAADLILTISLTYALLKRRKSKATLGLSNDDRIDGLIRLTVQTGAISSVASVTAAATFLLVPMVSYVWVLWLSRLHANAALSCLNARSYFRDRETIGESSPRPSVVFARLTRNGQRETQVVGASTHAVEITGIRNSCSSSGPSSPLSNDSSKETSHEV
ncbi:hypothetical protein Moror_5802 [Moniliophthora roreri MCA 2997]|uniref:DUF6534 domain-containing protein n=1 Tax=Moniliophthora roreri (strain MCA 2997) TaxID=1381753 RepID=V2X3A9_MONRO|nr:hypothetical protein Moror_5802 [Moniliophthora roreri MCA 2997]